MLLIRYLREGSSPSASLSHEANLLKAIPNLVWKDEDGETHANEITYSPDNLTICSSTIPMYCVRW